MLGPEFQKRKPAVEVEATVPFASVFRRYGQWGLTAHWCHFSANGSLAVPASSSADHTATKTDSTWLFFPGGGLQGYGFPGLLPKWPGRMSHSNLFLIFHCLYCSSTAQTMLLPAQSFPWPPHPRGSVQSRCGLQRPLWSVCSLCAQPLLSWPNLFPLAYLRLPSSSPYFSLSCPGMDCPSLPRSEVACPSFMVI